MTERRPPYSADSSRSELERALATQLRQLGAPPWQEEYRFHPTRKWRFDFAWPDLRLAVECEGATWARGRHTRGSGFAADCEKYNAAAVLGWVVLRYTRKKITDGRAAQEVKQYIDINQLPDGCTSAGCTPGASEGRARCASCGRLEPHDCEASR